MKRARLSEEQIIGVLKEAEAAKFIAERRVASSSVIQPLSLQQLVQPPASWRVADNPATTREIAARLGGRVDSEASCARLGSFVAQ